MKIVRILMILFCLLLCAAAYSLDSTTTKNLDSILAAMPEPTPEGLLHLYHNQKETTDPDKLALMILKLRETGNPDAVPALETIFKENYKRGGDYAYIIPQALFCIGTPQARDILEEYLLRRPYSAETGISETYRWKMKEPARSGFIADYFLMNTSNSMDINLDVGQEGIGKDLKYIFTITLKNVSSESSRICDNRLYMGTMLCLKSLSDNTFSEKVITLTFDAEMPDWIELNPGADHQFVIKGSLEKMKSWQRNKLNAGKESKYVLNTHDMVFEVKDKGEFVAYAVFENHRINEDYYKRLGIYNPWFGRAVSEPVIVDFK